MVKDNVKRICREQHRRINDVEIAAGISKGHIHKMTNPTLELLQRLAKELDVTVCELIGEDK